MNFSKIYAMARKWRLEMEAGGFTQEEGLKLLTWWSCEPRENAFVTAAFANCIETDTQEMP